MRHTTNDGMLDNRLRPLKRALLPVNPPALFSADKDVEIVCSVIM